MVANKRKRRIGKGKIIIIFGVLLLSFIFLFNYYASTSYYGTIEIRELKQDNNEYVVAVEGDFGVKKANFNEKETFNIVENEEFRVGNITEIWNDLSEGKLFQVLLKAYDNRNEFTLERIYLD
ncbi:hypothetical protein [Ornithinibacillus sp. 179-J 7C1 HS]|uniref:hypothetical protein n=1 Tax=Ornithinibacillus sp. 179-J 7C1 HS TaxID=3142384 RepID=UPI00399FFA4B